MGGSDASANALLVTTSNEVFAAGYTNIGGQKQLAIIKLKDLVTSVEEAEKTKADLQVYPNPSKGVFKIENAPAGSIVNIYNALGLKIHTKTLDAEPIVNLSANRPGSYMMEVISGSFRKLVKIEVQ